MTRQSRYIINKVSAGYVKSVCVWGGVNMHLCQFCVCEHMLCVCTACMSVNVGVKKKVNVKYPLSLTTLH